MKNLVLVVCFLSSLTVVAQTNANNFNKSVERAISTYQMDSGQASQFKSLFLNKYNAIEALKLKKLSKEAHAMELLSINDTYNASMLSMLNDQQDKLFMANMNAVVNGRLPQQSAPDPKKVKETKKMDFK